MILDKNALHSMFDKANQLWDAGNVKKAFKLFTIAAGQGDIYAQNSLGYFFDVGIAVSKNKTKALFWYRKSARGGDKSAYSNIATIYRDAGNIERARFWFLRAVKSGDGYAALELGKLYYKSQRKDSLLQASRYFRLAIKSKHISQHSTEEATFVLANSGGELRRHNT